MVVLAEDGGEQQRLSAKCLTPSRIISQPQETRTEGRGERCQLVVGDVDGVKRRLGVRVFRAETRGTLHGAANTSKDD